MIFLWRLHLALSAGLRRSSWRRGSLETAGLGKFEGHEGSESYDGGFTCDGGGEPILETGRRGETHPTASLS